MNQCISEHFGTMGLPFKNFQWRTMISPFQEFNHSIWRVRKDFLNFWLLTQGSVPYILQENSLFLFHQTIFLKSSSHEGFFENGQGEGPWISYLSNGQKVAEGIFEQGRRVKRWLYWDHSGNKSIES